MPFRPGPPNCARVRMTWIQGDATGQNVIHWQKTSPAPLTEAELELVVEQVIHAYSPGTETGPLGMISNGDAITLIEAVSLESDSAPGVERVLLLQGHVTDEPLPPAVAAVITLGTGVRGRSQRGRLFQMGVPNIDVGADGGFIAVRQAQWQTAWTNFVEDLADGANIAGSGVIASFEHNHAVRPIATTAAITSALVRTNMHTQRRRAIAG